MGFITKILERHRRKKATCTKALTDTGVVFAWPDKRPQDHFKWSGVSEIRTYKVDCFSYDDICLSFCVDGFWYEISERDAIFGQVMQIIESRFPGIPADWYSEVMLPPFETNGRLLWRAGNPGCS